MINPSSSVEAIGHSMFEALARNFPVACASDEFYYFPQVRLPEPQWSTWDCFSSENVADMVSDTRNYLFLLAKTLPELKPSLAALERFENKLQNVSTCKRNFMNCEAEGDYGCITNRMVVTAKRN